MLLHYLDALGFFHVLLYVGVHASIPPLTNALSLADGFAYAKHTVQYSEFSFSQ